MMMENILKIIGDDLFEGMRADAANVARMRTHHNLLDDPVHAGLNAGRNPTKTALLRSYGKLM